MRTCSICLYATNLCFVSANIVILKGNLYLSKAKSRVSESFLPYKCTIVPASPFVQVKTPNPSEFVRTINPLFLSVNGFKGFLAHPNDVTSKESTSKNRLIIMGKGLFNYKGIQCCSHARVLVSLKARF